MEVNNNSNNKPAPADYLANERTFLAWVRTSMGIMAFGFVVVKFSLFVKQISFILNRADAPELPADHGHYSALVGIILVGLGVVAIILSYIRYRNTNKQLETGNYEHSSLYISVLTAAIVLISVLLVCYLIKT